MHPIEVGGYRSNVPIFMEVQKPMTEFGINHNMEICEYI